MSSYQTHITATFLKHCSPHATYEWLSTNLVLKKEFKYFFSEVGHERTLLERLLLRRRHPLIDLGLAQFGCAPRTLSTVFARGDKGVRCAVLANPLLFDCLSPAVNLEEVVIRGSRQELEALALNANYPDSVFSSMINRTDHFSKLDELNYRFMLSRLGKNVRLSTPYDDTYYLDGMSDYGYHKVFTDAWKLTMTVPATQEWAHTLCDLLSRAEPPIGIENIEQILERWRIDRDSSYDTDYAFYLRSRLADLLDADERLLNSPDLAVRQSFYRRFSPWRFESWPEYRAKDDEEFFQQTLLNHDLWRLQKDRDKLRELAWSFSKGRSGDLDMVNNYLAYEELYREKYPEWFREIDTEQSDDSSAIARRAESLLATISEKVDALVAERGQPPKRWWR